MTLFDSLGLLYRELRDYVRFYDLDASARRVVFYAEDTASHSYFEGLVKQLIDVYALPVCYFTSDPKDPLFERAHPALHVFYIRQMLSFLTANLTAKVLVMTMPDLGRLHVKRSKHAVNHVYLFHNIGSSFPVIRYGALFEYDTIFCVGPHHKQEIRAQEKCYALREKKLVEFGYYRLEKTFDQYRAYESSKKTCTDQRTVLIAPSWGEHSILNVCGVELVRVVLAASCKVIVRPHPMTMKEHPQVISRLNAEFQHDRRYSYEGGVASVRSLYECDLLISDWSGVCYEYAFGTERPVLFVDVPQKIVNERYREVGLEPVDVGIRRRIGDLLDPARLDEAERKIQRLIYDRDRYVDEIRKAREELVYNFGGSSEAGAHYIYHYVNQAVESC